MDKNRRIIRLQSVSSTNDFLREEGYKFQESTVIAWTDYQSAGRGQGTNHWESEAGKNLLLSILTHPAGIAARDQYILSIAGALAVRDALLPHADGITVKWPNDIYWQDRKISGTLIETTLCGGRLRDCIFGIGINVNQRTFTSDAPNPVSLRQITGHDTPLEPLLRSVADAFDKYYAMATYGAREALRAAYKSALYRREGLHRYADGEGEFLARITDVEPDGHLVLTDSHGHTRRYTLKEVRYIIQRDYGKV